VLIAVSKVVVENIKFIIVSDTQIQNQYFGMINKKILEGVLPFRGVITRNVMT